MADVVTWKVEAAFDTDPRSTTDSDFTTDLSDRLRAFPGFESNRGMAAEFQDVNAGTCTIPLDNTDGELTPGNASGSLFGKLLPNRLVRISATYSAVEYWQFTGLIEAYEQIVEPGSPDQVCLLRVVDGFKVLNLERTPQFPDYPEEVERVLDPVWGYWRLNDPPTSRVKPGGWVKKKDNKDRDKKPQRKWRKAKKQRWLASASGPEARVLGNPSFLQSEADGPVAGELSYGIRFLGTQHLDVPIEAADDGPGAENAITVSAIIWPAVEDAPGTGTIITGPFSTSILGPSWELRTGNNNQISFAVNIFAGAASPSLVSSALAYPEQLWHHVVATYRGDTGVALLFVDGELAASDIAPGTMARGDAGEPIIIGYNGVAAMEGVISEVVVSERKPDDLFAADVEQLYRASIAGFGSPANLPLSGERIEAVLDGLTEADYSASYFTSSRRDIDAGEQDVLPQRLDESKLELLRRVEEAENGLLFVDTQGVLQFRDNAWFETGDGTDIYVTLASDGVGIDFQGIAPALSDDMLFPVVSVTREGGNTQTVGDTSEFFGSTLELGDTLHTTDSAALDRATKDQERFGQARQRIYSLDLNAMSDPDLYPIVLGADIGYRVVVNHTYPDATVETFDCRIIGIRRDSQGWEHRASWTLAPSYYPTVAEWYLGVPGFSELQTTTTLA